MNLEETGSLEVNWIHVQHYKVLMIVYNIQIQPSSFGLVRRVTGI